MVKPTDRDIAFCQWLTEVKSKNDTGTLAALRRGLMLEEEQLFNLYGYIPSRFLSGGEERLYLLIASLYALHPSHFSPEELALRRRNLGESLRIMARASGYGEIDTEELPEAIRRRFEILVSSDREELLGHLRQIISLLKSKDVPVDWAQLIADVRRWHWKGRMVQWDWSRWFYVGIQDKNTEGESSDENVS